jgi:hypothetical protein
MLMTTGRILSIRFQYYSNCSQLHAGEYCVKMTGIFEGKLGTKRFCSSRFPDFRPFFCRRKVIFRRIST